MTRNDERSRGYTDVRIDLFNEDWISCSSYLMYGKGVSLKIFNRQIRPVLLNHHLFLFDVVTDLASFQKTGTKGARKFKRHIR